ncbi:MAG TPA: DUF5413 family protein [Bradyrhizobium sp.]|uniref:DUF5413 family protein n=1 Tax=Bradyrhizobium sp. TaxID=376 RepID=UPI002D809ACC|nr:DUF5413 family protein [Bradyrhizobium sp.]HET7887759.1 DUF5413 family protein [Bradyrhizobium sp.]
MKRYVIFAALGPLFGGFLLLLATTVMSGFWSHPPSASEVGRLFTTFARTLQYSYLFGLLPALMLGAVDDIVMHIRRIGPALRVAIVAVVGFASAELLYGSRGPDSGLLQFMLYGLVGLVPGAVSSAVAHRFADQPVGAVPAS